MKITLLLGSIRISRQSHVIAHYLLKQLESRGEEAILIDLQDHPLPLMEERLGYHPNLPREVNIIGEELHKADALIFITPEYHGSFSGVLKNAVDYYSKEFKKKPIGAVTISGGKFGGINASTHLQQLILSLGAYPLPMKLLVPEVQNVFDAESQLPQQSLIQSVDRFLNEYIWFSDAIVKKKEHGVL
jgi:azobenzene reductase